MNSDKEIYGMAGVYIREHGEDAVIQAVMRADVLSAAGDLGGRNKSIRLRRANRLT
jgi:hypothetical protein